MAHQSAVNPTIAAIYAALNVPALLALATGGVYDGVPQRVTLPYVRIGTPTELRLDCMQTPGKDLSVQVHVFGSGRYEGTKQAGDIVSKAIALLHYQPLLVENHNLIGCQFEQTVDAGAEEEAGLGLVWHLVLTFRVQLEQAV